MSKTPTGGDPNASQRITCQAQPIKGTWGKLNKGLQLTARSLRFASAPGSS
jgi:hypothetical protein